MFPPTPPPQNPFIGVLGNPALLALLQEALSQAHPSMTGQPVALHPGVGAGINPGGPMLPAAPMPSQGQGLAPPEGPLGENAHLGWGTAPPMDYHTALTSAVHPHLNPHVMPQPGSPSGAPRPASRPPTRRGAGDFPRTVPRRNTPGSLHSEPMKRGGPVGDGHFLPRPIDPARARRLFQAVQGVGPWRKVYY